MKYNELQRKKLHVIGFAGASSAIAAVRRAIPGERVDRSRDLYFPY